MPENDNLPDRLTAALAEADKARMFVPPEVDAAILSEAKANLVRRCKPALVPWLAAAATVMIATFLTLSRPPKAREDVNRDGRVDIRDALMLARKVSAGQPLQGDWDLNHDGRVDQNDAAVIASQAVKLTKRGRS